MFAWFAMQKEQGFSMLDKRYQVFIMSSGLDLYTERSILSQSLISHGFSRGRLSNEPLRVWRLRAVK